MTRRIFAPCGLRNLVRKNLIRDSFYYLSIDAGNDND